MPQQSSTQDLWHLSPEALFLTSNELRLWKTLASDQERERFKEKYWRRRDTNPQTTANEFQALLRARIAMADGQFGVTGRLGSQTERGRVFVLLGPAAIERVVAGPLDRAPTLEANRLVFPRGAQLVREWHAWVYDRKKHPDLMAMLRRQELELTFTVDPGVGDELLNEPLFSEVRKMVAKKSIVNADDR